MMTNFTACTTDSIYILRFTTKVLRYSCGDIYDKMIGSIENTKLVLFFITENYVRKVAGSNANDK